MREEKEYLIMDDREYALKEPLPQDISEEDQEKLFIRLIEKYHLEDPQE